MNWLAILFIIFCLVPFFPKRIFYKRDPPPAHANAPYKDTSPPLKNVLDKDTALSLKGVFALFIVFHHFQVHYRQPTTFAPIAWIMEPVGNIAVGVFFFLSAFGVFASYQKYGRSYLRKMLFIKIPSLYVLHTFINGIYMLYALARGAVYSAAYMLPRIFGLDFLTNWDRISANSWFIFTIIAIYLLFIIVYSISAKHNLIAAIVFTVAIFALYILIYLNVLPVNHLYIRAIFCFPLGLFYAMYHVKINNFLTKSKKRYTLLTSAIGGLLLICYFTGFITSQLQAVAVCIFIVLILQKVRIKNRVYCFLGKISLGIYLLHGLFLTVIYNWFAPNAGLIEWLFPITALTLSLTAASLLKQNS
jgi:peptidoglycan/LPS O-acetylase OafA/YrhL